MRQQLECSSLRISAGQQTDLCGSVLHHRSECRPDPKASSGKACSCARPKHSHIRCQYSDGKLRERKKCPREEAIQHSEHDESWRIVYSNPAETQHSSDRCAGRKHIECSGFVGHKVGHNTPKNRSSIHNGHKIECKIWSCDLVLKSISADVEERDVEASKCKKETEGVEQEWPFRKSVDVVQLPNFAWACLAAHDRCANDAQE